MTSRYPPIEDLVPHAAPMLAIEELVSWELGEARCTMTVREGAPMVRYGRVAGVVTIEYMGQAVAACCGQQAYLGGEGVRYGVIIGCRMVKLEREWLPVGTELTIDVKRSRGNEMLSHFVCSIHDASGPVASATMTVYHATEMPD